MTWAACIRERWGLPALSTCPPADDDAGQAADGAPMGVITETTILSLYKPGEQKENP